MKEENLIFIISQPRSGSTYLQSLLSNNDEVNTCSEPWILLNFANQIKPKLIEGTFDNSLAQGAFYNYKKNFPELDTKQLLKRHILSIYEPLLKGHSYVIDKTPRYWEMVQEINELFPKARIIILRRNPLDVVRSLVKTYGMTSIDELNQFRRDLLYAPKWLKKFGDDHSGNPKVISLFYEDLKNNTKDVVSELYEWLGLSFSEKVLDTSTNMKYRGHFGDPFQNDEISYEKSKGKTTDKSISSSFNRFMQGYADYLGAQFLSDYGYGELDTIPKKTISFHYFTNLGPGNSEKRTNLKQYLKAVYLKSRSK